jgi:toxin-antitoxin system PIN domain toxin
LIAVDTNILVYAHRTESDFHGRASEFVRSLAEGNDEWAIPWPCAHEFLGLVTRLSLFKNPTSTPDALAQVAKWLRSPVARTLAEPPNYFLTLKIVLETSAVTGPKIHDARIAAICLAHGVTRLYSADRDFLRFGSLLTIVNPLT